MKTKEQNPKGLHHRFRIQKIVYEHGRLDWSDRSGGERTPGKYKLVDVDKDAEYFVMRLDEKWEDREHVKACRIGIHAYADAIEATIPQLAKDLRERYPLLPTPPKINAE